ncbi:MAG: DUF2461 domain-containing protein [Pseudomonadota bacterium]
MTVTFPADAFQFFADLGDENTKEFFQENRERFEESVKAPMAEIIERLSSTYGAFKLFRMNRDVRFSKDKSPYKLQQGAVTREDGRRYFYIDANGLLVATGAWQSDGAQLKRYREAIADETSGKKAVQIMNRLLSKDFEVSGGLDKPLASAPRGYPKDHPRIELLRWKGFMAVKRMSAADVVEDPALHKAIAKIYRDAKPLTEWCEAHLTA